MLATCSERIYPDIPQPPIPASVPLANHTGHFQHVAYGDIFVSLVDCDDDPAPPAADTPAGAVGPCRLRLSRGPGAQVKLAGDLEHKSGDFWLVFAVLEEVPQVVQACVRVQFRVDARGIVTHVAVDMRMEGEDGPLVEFKRIR
jgi:hypothetical protein